MTWLGLWLAACTTTPTAPIEAPPGPAAEVPVEPASPRLPDPMALERPTDTKLAASHVLLSWTGAREAADPARTEEEAIAIAREIRGRAEAGEDFAALARAHSEDPSGRRGGRLGVWRTGLMDDGFERCVAAAEPGEIAPLCRTGFGVHVIRRDPVVEASGRALVVLLPDADADADDGPGERAERLRAALAEGRPFEDLASDADQTVDLGRVGPGQLLPALEGALLRASPGDVVVVEVPGAIYVVQRQPEP